MPRSHRYGDFLFVHGSPRNPLSEYIFPEDIYNHRKMERLFQLVGRYCFQGHTHVPGIFTESYQFFAPEEIDLEYTLGEGKVMVNVGSVGQPRDGDNRACYVILEDGLGDDSGQRRRERRGRDSKAARSGRRLSIVVCLTISRPPSRRSTPFPSSSRSWATGSGKDGSLVHSTPRVPRPATGFPRMSRIGRRPQTFFWPSRRPVSARATARVEGPRSLAARFVTGSTGIRQMSVRPAIGEPIDLGLFLGLAPGSPHHE